MSTIDEADVLVEFNDYKHKTMPEGTPAEEWRFIMRRLSEPVRQRATLRYSVTTIPHRKSNAHVARQLPLMVIDVCLGYLPKI